MWPFLSALLPSLFKSDGILGTFLKTKADTAQAQATAALERQRAEIELIKQQGIDATESERNKLAATGQGFKYVTFVLINVPVILVCISPNRGRDIFENLLLIPVWYAQLYAAIYGIIWGIPVAANAMASIFSAIQSAWAMRQDKKIEKIQAVGEAKALGLDQAKKEIFDTMRKAQGAITQTQVDAINPILDKVLSAVTATAPIQQLGTTTTTTVEATK